MSAVSIRPALCSRDQLGEVADLFIDSLLELETPTGITTGEIKSWCEDGFESVVCAALGFREGADCDDSIPVAATQIYDWLAVYGRDELIERFDASEQAYAAAYSRSILNNNEITNQLVDRAIEHNETIRCLLAYCGVTTGPSRMAVSVA